MTLVALKEEYKATLSPDKMESKKDYDQLVQEIDEADSLNELFAVVALWNKDADDNNSGQMILRRIIK